MYWKNEKHSAAISTELAISIALAAIAIIVTLGLFGDNLAKMISSGNFQKFFLGGDKTTYSAFNRDYSDSNIETLMTGEQGLEQIRRIANNTGLDLINNTFNGTNNQKITNTIDYYALIIDAIVGEPHFCVYMKKDSIKKCSLDDIGGYKYMINLSTNYLSEVYPSGSTAYTHKNAQLLTFNNLLSALISDIHVTSSGESALTEAQKYDFIDRATKILKSIGYDGTIFNTGYKADEENGTSAAAAKIIKLKQSVKEMTSGIVDIASEEHNECFVFGVRRILKSGCGKENHVVDSSDLKTLKKWRNQVNTALESYNGSNLNEVESIILQILTTRVNGDIPYLKFKEGNSIFVNHNGEEQNICTFYQDSMADIWKAYGFTSSYPTCN